MFAPNAPFIKHDNLFLNNYSSHVPYAELSEKEASQQILQLLSNSIFEESWMQVPELTQWYAIGADRAVFQDGKSYFMAVFSDQTIENKLAETYDVLVRHHFHPSEIAKSRINPEKLPYKPKHIPRSSYTDEYSEPYKQFMSSFFKRNSDHPSRGDFIDAFQTFKRLKAINPELDFSEKVHSTYGEATYRIHNSALKLAVNGRVPPLITPAAKITKRPSEMIFIEDEHASITYTPRWLL